MPRVRHLYLDVIRIFACILIITMHAPMSGIGTNGNILSAISLMTAPGIGLFFMVSGFTLMPSVASATLKDFPKWYYRRLIRVVPITAVSYIACYITGYFTFKDPAQLFAVFVYPTLYWFVTAILIFYIIIFFIGKLSNRTVNIILCIALFILYVCLFGRQTRLYVIGLLSMLMGYMLREALTEGGEDRPRSILYIPGIVSGLIIFAIGRHLDNIGAATPGQAFLTGFGVLSAGIFALIFGYGFKGDIKGGSVIRFIGDMALPLYIVQCYKTGFIGYYIGLNIDFPMSFPVNFVVVWGLALILYLYGKAVSRLLTLQRKDNVV